MFFELIAYKNEFFLHITNNSFYFYNIKTFSSNSIIDNIKIKTYTKMKFFVDIKERHIYKD